MIREEQFTEDQKACYALLVEVFRGEHHVPHPIRHWGRGIKISVGTGALSTFDFDYLTRLVILAHDRMVRVEICTSGPGRAGVALHKRHGRDGDICHRHPTIWQAIASIRKEQPRNDFINRLRGIYSIGPGDPPEFGHRKFEVAPIQLEASDRIEHLEAQLADALKGGDALAWQFWRDKARALESKQAREDFAMPDCHAVWERLGKEGSGISERNVAAVLDAALRMARSQEG